MPAWNKKFLSYGCARLDSSARKEGDGAFTMASFKSFNVLRQPIDGLVRVMKVSQQRSLFQIQYSIQPCGLNRLQPLVS